MKLARIATISLGTFVLGTLPAQAGTGFGDSPIARFTKEDHALSKQAAREALDSAPDGQAVTWSNPNTKATGSVKPLKTLTENGMTCRLTQFDNEAAGKKGRVRYKLCKTADGSWKATTK
jgi:surface antigen